ncbi:MAG: hypothetical protein ACTS8P_04320 [Arsenophonus sp. NC-XBC3-MAG3]
MCHSKLIHINIGDVEIKVTKVKGGSAVANDGICFKSSLLPYPNRAKVANSWATNTCIPRNYLYR